MQYKEIYDENMLSNEETARIVQFPLMSTFFFTRQNRQEMTDNEYPQSVVFFFLAK